MTHLVLTCQPGESIRIGDDITITYHGKDLDSAVLSVEASAGEIVCPGELEEWFFEDDDEQVPAPE